MVLYKDVGKKTCFISFHSHKTILYNLHQNFYRRNMIEIAFKLQNIICARIILRQNKITFSFGIKLQI